VNSSSNWKQTLQLRDNLVSSSWGYPLKHGYDKCYRIVALEWMSERCTPPRLTVGPSILKLKCALHCMNMGDNMNIIDDVETFLSTIWFDKLRGIHEKEHWAYNDESFTASYELHVWMTGWFPWRLVITYTWRVLFQLEASLWLVDHLDGCWYDAHNQSEVNFQKNPGEKILHDESSNTTLGGRVKLDKQWEQ